MAFKASVLALAFLLTVDSDAVKSGGGRAGAAVTAGISPGKNEEKRSANPPTTLPAAAEAKSTWIEGENNLSLGFIWIEPGTFVMGSPRPESDRDNNEGPQTRVTISRGFWMAIHEVTQREFSRVMHHNPSRFKGDLLPVEQVSWFVATNYCATLTIQERAAGRLLDDYSYRLPTEAEWEFACRAGTRTRFSYGDDPGYANLGKYGWVRSNSGNQTHPVGQELPNPWGLKDMYGNVFEWCSTWYAAYPGGSVTDPTGPSSGSNRAMRGGSWLYFGGDCRSAARGNYDPSDGLDDYFGLRVVVGRSP